MTLEKSYSYHHCDQSNIEGIEIVFANFYGEDGAKEQWWLHLYREASEEDAMEGEAHDVGDLLFSSAIVISYCPFCGCNLNDE